MPVLFYSQEKISICVPQGRLVAPIHVKFGAAEGHMGPLGCAKYRENFHFLAKSRPAGVNPLTDFYNIKGFYTPNNPA